MPGATLTVDGTKYPLDVLQGSEGERALDITRLHAATGLLTFDPGFANTASCKSAITYIDGSAGVLRHRGYSIEALASSKQFMEVAYLLIRGELPSEDELHQFEDRMAEVARPPEGIRVFFETMPKDADPMAVLAAGFAALPAYAPPRDDAEAAIQLLARSKTLAAYWFQRLTDGVFVEPNPNLRWSRDLLRMMLARGNPDYEPPKALDDAFNLLLLLHADHEQNCSTSTARMVASSGASLHASIAAAVGALSGRRHGGANLAVIEMLEQLSAEGGDPERLLDSVRRGQRKLMGFGHRVYKNHDPRARIIKQAAYAVLEQLGHEEPLLGLAVELEHIALDDPYFQKRKLYPNVDFYSGLIYRAMGIPKGMFPVMFALGRLPGWIAQVMELRAEENVRICRPRQLYTGRTERSIDAGEKASQSGSKGSSNVRKNPRNHDNESHQAVRDGQRRSGRRVHA